jgi:mevalonate kinase
MYPSKILLFGEYTILLNSYALAIPYHLFKGELIFKDAVNRRDNTYQRRSNLELKKFLAFSAETKINERLAFRIDFESFKRDLKNKLYFNSDIPEESGLGSSGALVAAIFDRYSEIGSKETDIQKIRNCLALMESYYHGNSSGIDPLVSYLRSPLLIKGNEINVISANRIGNLLQEYGFFIGFGRQSSGTGEQVKKFNNRCKSDREYLDKIIQEYIPVNNECIMSMSEPDNGSAFFSNIGKLSGMQLEIFNEMIPDNLNPMINYGLKNNLFYLKLCGSGGGGHFLGFTAKRPETDNYFKELGYQILFY